MNASFWWAVWSASIVGSLHCAGMCGPLATVATGCGCGAERRGAAFAYQSGRLSAYLVLGAVAGMLGSLVDGGAGWLGWQQAAAWLAGLGLMAVGLIALARLAGVRLPHQRVPHWLARRLSAVRRWSAGLGPRRRAAVLGLLTGALPCGWLYAFLIIAAGTGTAWSGTAVMALFWSGSVPVLTVIGLGSGWFVGRLRRHATWVTAVLLVAVGTLTLVHRTGASFTPWLEHVARQVRPEAGATGPTADDVRRVADEVPPCCRTDESADE